MASSDPHRDRGRAGAAARPASRREVADALDRYVRDIAPLPLLTVDEERALGHEVREADRLWREAILENPATALCVLERWSALRRSGRIGTRMVESSSEPEERRLVRAMSRLQDLCDARAKAGAAERERIESSIQRLLGRIDLSVRLLERIERDLGEHPARAARQAGVTAAAMRGILQRSCDARERLLEAKQRFACANVKLVIHIAKAYSNRGLSLADVIQEGNLGLLRAVEKFDPDRGVRFSSYAAWWIRQAIQRGIQSKAGMIRVPSLLQQRVQRLGRDDARRRSQGEEQTPFEEQARFLRMEPSEAVGLLASLREPVSIDAPAHDDSDTLVNNISDPDSTQMEEVIETRHLGGMLQGLMGELEPRERLVVERRFGISRHRPETLEAIGKDLRLSRERIRQIEKRALERLRELISDRMPHDELFEARTDP